MERSVLAVVAGLAATAFLVPDAPVRQEALAHGMPAAAEATYQLKRPGNGCRNQPENR